MAWTHLSSWWINHTCWIPRPPNTKRRLLKQQHRPDKSLLVIAQRSTILKTHLWNDTAEKNGWGCSRLDRCTTRGRWCVLFRMKIYELWRSRLSTCAQCGRLTHTSSVLFLRRSLLPICTIIYSGWRYLKLLAIHVDMEEDDMNCDDMKGIPLEISTKKSNFSWYYIRRCL